MLVIAGRNIFLVAALALYLAGRATFAFGAEPEETELGAGIEKLFDLGEKSTPPAISAAREQYERLKHNRPKDTRIDYAYALVLVNQHKYRDAVPLLSDHLDAGKPDSAAYCVKIWAEVQERKAATAVNDMVALSRQFPRAAAAQEDPAYLEIASFMGAMFGYLDLVRPEGLDPRLKAQRRNEIMANIRGKYLAAFDQGRDAVRDRLTEMQQERNTKQDEITAAAEKRLEQEKTVLDSARSTLAAQRDTMKSSAETVQDAQRELNVIQQQLTSLVQDRTRFSAQIIIAQTQLAEIQAQVLLNGQRPGANNSNNGTNGRINISPQQIAVANAIGVSLGALNRQAFNIDRQIMTLQAQAATLTAKGAKGSEILAESEELMRKTSKQARAMEKRLLRPEAAKKAHPGMTPKMASLATYIPFPYEEERERVLDWFAK